MANSSLQSSMNQSEYFTPQSHDHSTSNGSNLSKVKEQGLTESSTGLHTKDVQEKLESGYLPKTQSQVDNSDHELKHKEKVKELTNGYQLQSNSLEKRSDSSYHHNQIDRTEGQPLDNHVTNTDDKFQRDTEEEARPKNGSLPHETLADTSLVPTILYQHRVRGLVLALLVEPEFNTDPTAREEVVRSFCC